MALVDAVVVDEAEVADGDRHLQILITIRHLTRTQKRYLLSMGLLDMCMGACMQKWHVGSLDGDILQTPKANSNCYQLNQNLTCLSNVILK